MFWTKNRIVFAPADATGAAVEPAGGADAAPSSADAPPASDTGSILYPNEGKQDAPPEAAEPAEADPLDTVPEDGKYDLKMPEGVEVDTSLLDQFSPKFKELGLTTKQAQALADQFIAARQAQVEAQQANWAKMTSDWASQAQKDPEMGGPRWDETVSNATKVVGRFGNDGLKQFLNDTGAGNHPEVIRFMAKVGAMIGEDNPAITETRGKAVAQDTAAILYPDDQPKG